MDEVEAVVAYGSYRDFEGDRGTLAQVAEPGRQPVFTFGWSFFVPSSSERTDDDLLREAVELAQTDEISAWRAAVQRWRRNSILKGESDAEALSLMEAMIAEYGQAARKRKIRVRLRWGFAVATAAAGAADRRASRQSVHPAASATRATGKKPLWLKSRPPRRLSPGRLGFPSECGFLKRVPGLRGGSSAPVEEQLWQGWWRSAPVDAFGFQEGLLEPDLGLFL